MTMVRRAGARALIAATAVAGIILLAGCGQAKGAEPQVSEPPSPTALPESGSRAESILSCMAGLGYEGSIGNDGTITFPPVPDEQHDLFQEDMNSCTEETPYVPLNDTQVREMYALELENKTCLEGLGYQVEEPPSEDVYIDTYNTATWWFAIASLDALPTVEFNEAVRACPPPTFFN
ncbi:hypothetical protein [Agromyces laixinhei]|uniref:hypothetical protein n=1 Tax=Agromyces laixinhei TaxID=2585717 RepID=UPI0012EE3FBD|nr:hypothetical protein [Agromyces laixinhei]